MNAKKLNILANIGVALAIYIILFGINVSIFILGKPVLYYNQLFTQQMSFEFRLILLLFVILIYLNNVVRRFRDSMLYFIFIELTLLTLVPIYFFLSGSENSAGLLIGLATPILIAGIILVAKKKKTLWIVNSSISVLIVLLIADTFYLNDLESKVARIDNLELENKLRDFDVTQLGPQFSISIDTTRVVDDVGFSILESNCYENAQDSVDVFEYYLVNKKFLFTPYHFFTQKEGQQIREISKLSFYDKYFSVYEYGPILIPSEYFKVRVSTGASTLLNCRN
ncbi:MAG: hypothetical protein HQ556_08405 [Candidatus Marinimicrobia bacterium]|nr:hypothetical protein [Candidatus Neomarinimicrobiota bacterium]